MNSEIESIRIVQRIKEGNAITKYLVRFDECTEIMYDKKTLIYTLSNCGNKYNMVNLKLAKAGVKYTTLPNGETIQDGWNYVIKTPKDIETLKISMMATDKSYLKVDDIFGIAYHMMFNGVDDYYDRRHLHEEIMALRKRYIKLEVFDSIHNNQKCEIVRLKYSTLFKGVDIDSYIVIDLTHGQTVITNINEYEIVGQHKDANERQVRICLGELNKIAMNRMYNFMCGVHSKVVENYDKSFKCK